MTTGAASARHALANRFEYFRIAQPWNEQAEDEAVGRFLPANISTGTRPAVDETLVLKFFEGTLDGKARRGETLDQIGLARQTLTLFVFTECDGPAEIDDDQLVLRLFRVGQMRVPQGETHVSLQNLSVQVDAQRMRMREFEIAEPRNQLSKSHG